MAILREIVGKFAAVRGSATARADAVKSCATERALATKFFVQDSKTATSAYAKKRILHMREDMKIWFKRAKEDRAIKAEMRRFNKEMYKQECERKRRDYLVRIVEYKEWRMDQGEIADRALFKRLKKLKIVGPNVKLPKPRPGLYDRKTSPLPPKKLMLKSFKEYLESTEQVVGLFDKAVHVVFIKPSRSIAVVSGIGLAGFQYYEELKRPGSLDKRMSEMLKIFNREGTNQDKQQPNQDEEK